MPNPSTIEMDEENQALTIHGEGYDANGSPVPSMTSEEIEGMYNGGCAKAFKEQGVEKSVTPHTATAKMIDKLVQVARAADRFMNAKSAFTEAEVAALFDGAGPVSDKLTNEVAEAEGELALLLELHRSLYR